ERQALAHRAAEERANRHAQRLGLDVDQRVLDGADGLLVDAAGRLPRHRVERRGDALEGARILADQPLAQRADDGGEAAAAIALVIFRPADDAVIGGDLEEREDAPAGVAMQILDPRDAHDPSSRLAAPARSAARLAQAYARRHDAATGRQRVRMRRRIQTVPSSASTSRINSPARSGLNRMRPSRIA